MRCEAGAKVFHGASFKEAALAKAFGEFLTPPAYKVIDWGLQGRTLSRRTSRHNERRMSVLWPQSASSLGAMISVYVNRR
jgi:hypothetical protein